MLSQPKMESLDNPTAYRTGLALLGVGSAFVISSFLALGFTGTFLGKTPREPGGPEHTHSGSGGSRGWVAACPAICDIFMGSPGGPGCLVALRLRALPPSRPLPVRG